MLVEDQNQITAEEIIESTINLNRLESLVRSKVKKDKNKTEWGPQGLISWFKRYTPLDAAHLEVLVQI